MQAAGIDFFCFLSLPALKFLSERTSASRNSAPSTKKNLSSLSEPFQPSASIELPGRLNIKHVVFVVQLNRVEETVFI